MRYFLIVLLIFFALPSFAENDFIDVDYNFIDTAFDGIKPVSDKEFNDTINKLTPAPVDNSPKGKLKAFLFGRKYGVETPSNVTPQEKEADEGGEVQAIKNLTNGIYFIKLIAPIISFEGTIIPVGNYKIQQKIINEKPMLIFSQGYKEYGMLKLTKYEDMDKNENDIAYSRVDIVSPSLIRIVYSTLDDTKCALAKVYLQN